MKYDHYIGRGFHRWTEGKYAPSQLKVWNDHTSSFILLSGAYRSGKSEIACRIGIRHLYHFPLSKVGVFRQFLASIKKTTLLTFLELIHPSWVYDWSNSDLVLTLKNGSVASFIGAEHSDRLGSIELTLALVDEASELSEESLGMIAGRLSGQLDPPPNYDKFSESDRAYIENTKDLRQMVLVTNPKTEKHPLYERFIKKPKPGHIVYTGNSVSNPNLPETYVTNVLAAYCKPGTKLEWISSQVAKIRSGESPADGLHLKDHLTPFGQRNLLGLWVALEGAVYQMDADEHLVDSKPHHYGPQLEVIAGIDFGFHNPRILVLSRHTVVLAGESLDAYMAIDYWSGKESTQDDLISQMVKLSEQWNISKFYVPPDQPGIKKTAKKTLGSSAIKSAKNSVKPGINSVARLLSQRRLYFLKHGDGKHELCWAEMGSYSWKKDRNGNPTDDVVKEGDHYPDALRYAIYTRHHREAVIICDDDHK